MSKYGVKDDHPSCNIGKKKHMLSPPQPFGDNRMLLSDRETPLGNRNRFWVLALYFLVMGEFLKVRNVVFWCGLVNLVAGMICVHERVLCGMMGMYFSRVPECLRTGFWLPLLILAP